jgi:non-canonical purine NTP pyrophosphatase (RdgB/HAM1 family)
MAREENMEALTFVTSNPGKAKQISRYLSFPVVQKAIDLIEIQSLDGAEIIEHKAREAYRHLHSPVLVEDASLRFLALGKLPGPLIKWFLEELGTDGLCKLLNGYEDRSALASVQFGLYDGQSFHIFSGERAGSIAPTPRGSNGFGWDSIFIPAGHNKTWAEMNDTEMRETAMRTIALEKLGAYLKTIS